MSYRIVRFRPYVSVRLALGFLQSFRCQFIFGLNLIRPDDNPMHEARNGCKAGTSSATFSAVPDIAVNHRAVNHRAVNHRASIPQALAIKLPVQYCSS